MNPCISCGNKYTGQKLVITETTFGQGDSTHKCYVKCSTCGHTSKEATGWLWFDDRTFRAAMDNWDEEHTKLQSHLRGTVR